MMMHALDVIHVLSLGLIDIIKPVPVQDWCKSARLKT